MNQLSQKARDLIVEPIAVGKGAREISALTSISVEAVRKYMPGAYRRKFLGIIDSIFQELESKGVDPTDIQSLMAGFSEIGRKCPVHPEGRTGCSH